MTHFQSRFCIFPRQSCSTKIDLHFVLKWNEGHHQLAWPSFSPYQYSWDRTRNYNDFSLLLLLAPLFPLWIFNRMLMIVLILESNYSISLDRREILFEFNHEETWFVVRLLLFRTRSYTIRWHRLISPAIGCSIVRIHAFYLLKNDIQRRLYSIKC